MLNSKEYFKQLETTLAVKELDDEAAAAIQGGWDLIGYNKDNKAIAWANVRIPKLTSSNNKIDSVRINKGQWKFYDLFNYKGASVGPLGPNKPGERWYLNGYSNWASSLKDLTG